MSGVFPIADNMLMTDKLQIKYQFLLWYQISPAFNCEIDFP